MKNVLLDKGIILPSGEISKDKVNLVTGAITQPFAEMVWVTTGGDMETVNRLTDVLVTMNTPADRGKLFKIIKMLYGLMGLPFSEEAEPMDADPAVLEYFIFSFTADFGEVIQDLIAEEAEYFLIGKSRAKNTATGSKLAACGRRHALREDKPLHPQSERSERRRQWVKLP